MEDSDDDDEEEGGRLARLPRPWLRRSRSRSLFQACFRRSLPSLRQLSPKHHGTSSEASARTCHMSVYMSMHMYMYMVYMWHTRIGAVE